MSQGGPLSQADLLAFLRRTTDSAWLQAMLDQPDGAAIIASKLAVFEATSEAVMAQADATMISTAPTGRSGVCTLTLSRSNTSVAGTIPKGYSFVTNLGVALTVATDTIVATSQGTVAVPLETVRMIDLVNTPGPAFDDLLASGGYVDAALGTNGACSFFDLPHTAGTLTYVSSTAITGAAEDWLSALGAERGCYRQDGEDGEAYRARVRMIPDAVSPRAIAAAVDAPSTVLPPRWLAEPFNDGADVDVRLAMSLGFFDAPFCDIGTGGWPLSYCDDWLGTTLAAKNPVATVETPGMRESRAYFRIDLVGPLCDPDGLLLYADVGYTDDTEWGFPDIGCPPGSSIGVHPVIGAASQALLHEAQTKKAGGVQFDIYLEDATILQAQDYHNGTTDPTGAVVWTLTPESGTAWYLREGLATGDAGEMMNPTTQGIKVRLTLVDDTIIDTGWRVGCLPLRMFELQALGYHGQRVAKIEGLVRADASAFLNLVGNFLVSTCTI